MKPRVTGFGGIFFKAKDSKALDAWYAKHLGFEIQPWGGSQFHWNASEGGNGYTVWSPFAEDTAYFRPSTKPYMVNLRVNDLDGLLAALRADGVEVLDRREEAEYGKFGYVVDPEGTLLELFEPAPDHK